MLGKTYIFIEVFIFNILNTSNNCLGSILAEYSATPYDVCYDVCVLPFLTKYPHT